MSSPSRDADLTALPRQDSPATDAPLMAWSVHLARQRRRGLARLSLCALVVLFCGLLLFHNVWLALLPTAALLLSLSDYLFPIRYTLTRDTAQARYGLVMLEMPWRDVRHAYLTDEGVKLSPLAAKNSRFEPLRGIFLRFDDTNREAVIALIRRLRAEAHDH